MATVRDIIEGILKSRIPNPDVTLLNQLIDAATPSGDPWTAVAFEGDWHNYNSPTEPGAGYYKDILGRVHLRGRVIGTDPEFLAFTLPAGYRPSARLVFVVPDITDPDAAGSARVHNDGTVLLFGTASGVTSFALNGISFLAEA